jgi:hypothetical protein
MKAKKNRRERSPQMKQVSAGLRDVLGISEWRKEHPKATFREIEAAVDERVNQLRAQLIEDVVQMGETEEWSQKRDVERPNCASCGQPLLARGERTRYLQTSGGGSDQAEANVWHLSRVRGGFFSPWMRS